MTGRLVAIMCERKGVVYDCISWINRNYKESGCFAFEKIFGFWQGLLYYNIQLITFKRSYEVKSNGR